MTIRNIDDLINELGEKKTAELFIEYFIRLAGPELPSPSKDLKNLWGE